VCEAFELPR